MSEKKLSNKKRRCVKTVATQLTAEPHLTGMIPVGMKVTPPNDPALALVRIQASASWLAENYAKTRRSLSALGPSTPGATLEDDMELHRRAWRQKLQALDDRVTPLYTAVERFISDFIDMDFARVCKSGHRLP